MLLRLSTVRAKLTMLVALSALASLAALLVLSWIMHRQLVDEVDDRVPEAVRGFDLELADDLRDLSATVRDLDSQAAVEEALRNRSADAARAAAQVFHEEYPEIDIAMFDASGQLLVQLGLAAPLHALSDLPDLAALHGTDELRLVTPHGCEHPTSQAPAGLVVARRVGEAGVVMGCIPLDADFATNASSKLGVEVMIVDPQGEHVASTPRFPKRSVADVTMTPLLADEGAQEWALARVEPAALVGRTGRFGVILALDVTDIRAIVRQNMVVAGAFLFAAAAFSIVMGARLASLMSRALARVNTALRKLEQQEYVHVDAIKTGDELEDLALGFNTMVDGLKERDKLRTTFGKYMTQTVMDHLLAGKVALGGESITVTILFSDIRSFTTISEKMDAQQLVGLLNEYFTEMVTIVMEEDGVVDKYIGDAIMAVFGAPVNKPDDAVRAVRAAVRMRAALAKLNVRLAARGIPELKTGIGIHTGEVVAGNIGSEARMEYTVIGDAVNLASRLESATKEMGVNVLMSDETYELVKDAAVARPLREITVKGRVKPVLAYEVTATKDPIEEAPSGPRSAPASRRG